MRGFVIGDGVNVKTCIDFNDGVGVIVGDVVVNICNDNKDDEEEKDRELYLL
jgi:tryptophan synthase alpha subunit